MKLTFRDVRSLFAALQHLDGSISEDGPRPYLFAVGAGYEIAELLNHVKPVFHATEKERRANALRQLKVDSDHATDEPLARALKAGIEEDWYGFLEKESALESDDLPKITKTGLKVGDPNQIPPSVLAELRHFLK